jgi:hypothetical protein
MTRTLADMPDVLTVTQLAAVLGRSRRTIDRLISRPIPLRGCIVVHTPTTTELYFKDARAREHVSSQELMHAIGKAAFISFVEAWPQMAALSDGVADRTVRVTVDRRTDRVSEWWVGRRNDWSGRHGLRARLLSPVTSVQPETGGERSAQSAAD